MCACGPFSSQTVKPVQTVTVTKVVHEDIPVPDVPVKPPIPVYNFTGKETDAEVTQDYVLSVSLLENYADQLEAALQPFIIASKVAAAAPTPIVVPNTPPAKGTKDANGP